ncbi:ABC transporter substrate-binding protein [Salinisphaera shabanensis E1L3A]|uniref:ABC transporter substrate-binding protein n=1 Tax=Salinisphaera shabanensis E1L3A TaxID=1033802 RepID=U2FZT8_9GAMM|nr:BMP family ABC transporter substrate-binding protein [Salinisphaera shabanensis]ERJ19593.1 ABC transporter substrate-binding protein [Salinisphaera shabanensis E1L3A]
MKDHRTSISRRRLLQAAGGLGGLGLVGGLVPTAVWAADTLSIGFIYVGPKDDFGYNQAHAEGAAAIAAMDGTKIYEQEGVPETLEVQKVMESMINFDRTQMLFPTSFGYYDPHIKKIAPKYPDVKFLHAGGLYEEGDPENASSYFGYIDEAQYVAGTVAGHMTQTKKLGFVAAKPIPQVLRNINAYTLAARKVDPEITTQVIFTGDWAMPVKEAEATNSLVNQGVDVITCHVDSPKVVSQTAAERGAYVTGYHVDQSPLAPQQYLTGAEWNWGEIYPRFVKWQKAGKDWPHLYRGGLKDGFVKTSDYGPAVTDAARKAGDEAIAYFMSGEGVIYKGELKDNRGNVVIPAGQEREQTDIQLEKMDYLVEGVIGSTSA